MSGRFWMMVPLSLVGALSAASGEMASPCAAGAPLSSFDYVVLASMADTPRPISLASYRAKGMDDSDRRNGKLP
jgi:hypothetical protein